MTVALNHKETGKPNKKEQIFHQKKMVGKKLRKII